MIGATLRSWHSRAMHVVIEGVGAAVLSAFRTLGWWYRVASAFQFLMLASLVPPEFHSCRPRGRFQVLQSVVVWNSWVLVRPATVATVAAAAADTSCSRWQEG